MKQLLWLLLLLLSPRRINMIMYEDYGESEDFANFENSEDFEKNQHISSCYVSGTLNEPTDQQEEYYDQYGRRQSRLAYNLLYQYVCNYVSIAAREPLKGIDTTADTITSISFNNSRVSLIPVGVFTPFTNLIELYLNNSFVNSIHPGAFTGLTKLNGLYLQENNISTVSKGILNSFPYLTILNLSNNNIEIIEEHAFLGLFSLQEIYLNNNKIKQIQPDMFHELKNLSKINLSYNILSAIPLNLFSDLEFEFVAGFIDLSNNNFSKIDFLVFSTKLKYLILQNNHITSIANWSHLQSIINLDLSNNALRNIDDLQQTLLSFSLSGNLIETVQNSLFAQSKEINIIDLSRNLLKGVNVDTFQGLKNLTNLFLQNNQITNIEIGCFRDLQCLQELNLSSNEIAEFEYGTFSGLSILKILDISDNKLAYLYESSFYDLNNLEVLDMKHNLITSFDPYELKDHCKNLKIAYLNNNRWVCKSLLHIVKILEKENVTIVTGTTKTANVRGIACLNYNSYNTNPTFIADFENNMKNESIAKLYAISSEMDAFKKFFNIDFLNSNFYKYFESFNKFNSTLNVNDSSSKAFLKYFDDGFKNTTFYKYFKSDLGSSSFFERFNAASEKLSTALNSLDANFKNSTFYNFINSDVIGKNIFKYFDNGFKSSGFYKYFSKEFLNSEFFKYFDKTLQMRIDSNLLKIRNYFNYDFKNSSFSKFFGEEHSNFINNTNLNANVARLIDNTPEINTYDIVGKISELTDVIKSQEDAMQSARSGTAIFMTFVIIILLGITCLLAINNLRTRFNRNVCKSVSDNNESQVHIADAEMEMM